MYCRVPPAHAHFFEIKTTEELGHHHLLRLYTFSNNGTAYDGHVHQYKGITSIVHGHYHTYYGTTGPAIPLQNGEHFHMLEGIVEYNVYNTSRKGALVTSAKNEGLISELHRHAYSGYSTVGIGYEQF